MRRLTSQFASELGDESSDYASGDEYVRPLYDHGYDLPYELVFADPEDLRSTVVDSLVGAVDDFDVAYADFLRKRQACLSWKASNVPSAPITAADSGLSHRFEGLQERWRQLAKETDIERYYAKWGVEAEGVNLISRGASDLLARGGKLDAQVQHALDELYVGLDVRNALGAAGAASGPPASREAPRTVFGREKKRIVAGSADVDLGFAFSGTPPRALAVSRVDTGGWAHRTGVEVGDALLEVNGTSVEDMSAAYLTGAMSVRPITIVFKGRVWKHRQTAEQRAAAAQKEALQGVADAASRLEAWLEDTIQRAEGRQEVRCTAEEAEEAALARERRRQADDIRREVGFLSDELQTGLFR